MVFQKIKSIINSEMDNVFSFLLLYHFINEHFFPEDVKSYLVEQVQARQLTLALRIKKNKSLSGILQLHLTFNKVNFHVYSLSYFILSIL